MGYIEVKLKYKFNTSQLVDGDDPDAWVNELLQK